MRRDWPFAGRSKELSVAMTALTRGTRPHGVVLAGAAGVGKSRLAQEVLAAARQRGAVTHWARATLSARDLPLGAFAGLVSVGRGDPIQVLRDAADELVSEAGERPVVVGVDDAHLLDKLSALLVYRSVLNRRASVVATIRSGEPALEEVTALWKDDLLDRIDLRPLSEDQGLDLLEAVLDGPVESAASARLWALTRGNALFLRHLVEAELEAGRLYQVQGVWRWSGRRALSSTLVELVESRMGAMAGPVLEVVNVLAVGEPLEVGLLGRLTDPLAAEQAEAAGLVSVENHGSRMLARLAHPLYGEVQRLRLGELAARRMRGRLVRALTSEVAGRAERPEDLLRRAVLAMESDHAPDADLLTTAARVTVQHGDLGLAEQLARRAVEAGGGFESRLALSYTLSWLSRGAEADAQLAVLVDLAHTDAERVQVVIPWAANRFWVLKDPAGAQRTLRRAEAHVRDEDAGRALRALWSGFDVFLGRPQQAVDSATDALESDQLPTIAVLVATWGLVGGLGLLGRADEIAAAAALGYEASGVDAVPRFALSDLQIIGLRLAGYLVEAERVAEDRYREGVTAVGVAQIMGVALRGHAALARGRPRTAIRCLREAIAGFSSGSETGGWDHRCRLSLTQALAMAGDAPAAHEALSDLEAHTHPSFVFLEPEVVLARGWVAAAEGMVSEAIERAHDAAALAERQGQLASQVMALHSAVCFGDRDVADELARLARQVDGPRAPGAAAQAAALAADDGHALQAVSVRLEQTGDLVAAADAIAQAAAAFRRQGLQGSAHAATARAHLLAEACEGARTPALMAAVRPLPVTPREREIVTLAARGLSNREIAERLVVSVRTVEGHLYRASVKLGVKDRTELAQFVLGD